MSDTIPKAPAIKIGGLGRQAQKLQAMREKAANQATGTKAPVNMATPSKAKALAGTKKTSFQRKAV